MKTRHVVVLVASILLSWVFPTNTPAQTGSVDDSSDVDQKVRQFLASHKGQWYDMNVSAQDGETLYRLVLNNKYKSASVRSGK